MNRKFLSVCMGLLAPALIFAKGHKDITLFWGDTDVRYAKTFSIGTKDMSGNKAFAFPAWKGEKVNAQAVITAGMDLEDVKVTFSELKASRSVIPSDALSGRFVKPVTADTLLASYGQCGARTKSPEDSISVADIIDTAPSTMVKAGETQAVWVSVNVPADAVPGRYKGKMTVTAKGVNPVSIPVELTVKDMLMPAPENWKFHLDLWQNPYAVARYHDVPLWSSEHFEYMKPVMKMLADAGQKVITATIMDKPWNGQTEDPFGSMVTKMKKVDGSWYYDYSIFDMWVEFMMSVGIKDQISCYTLIPWNLRFDYFDQTTGQVKYVVAKPGSKDYTLYWGSFIKDFCNHVRAKGWFEKTVISMDERSKEAMEAALELIRSVEPDLKVSLAGSLHENIEPEIYDLCVTSKEPFPADVRERRKSEGKVSTYYTCCAEKYPNTFIASEPFEASWLGWYAAAKNFDGYLRWAYNSWTVDPLADARFRSWTSGDCYIVYPEGRSSIRFEKLIEGIRDYEKILILKDKWTREGNKAKLAALDALLSRFEIANIPLGEGPVAISDGRKILANE